ncbi:MAG: hypothetical protein AAF224_03935 [Pseudomonadota bacterium]
MTTIFGMARRAFAGGQGTAPEKVGRLGFDDGEEPRSVWPKAKILKVLEDRYGDLEMLGEEAGYSLYGAVENDIRFAIVLVHASTLGTKTKDIAEVGFVARFTSFPLTETAEEGINRNLHISVVARDAGGDLFLIGGVLASGEFNDGAFALVLDAWRRDLIVTLQGVTGGSLADSHPATQFSAVRTFAQNHAPNDEHTPLADVLDRFMGADRHAPSVGDAFDGGKKRGFLEKIGFLTRVFSRGDGV